MVDASIWKAFQIFQSNICALFIYFFPVYYNWQRMSSWYFAHIMDALKLGMKQGFQGQTGAQRHGDIKDNISK